MLKWAHPPLSTGVVSKLQKYQQVWKMWNLKYEIMASAFNS